MLDETWSRSKRIGFLGVVRLGGVARRGPDAAVALADQIFVGELFLAAVAPIVSGGLVEPLGECLGEPVGQCLDHDRAVVVVLGFKAADEFDRADSAVRAKAPR